MFLRLIPVNTFRYISTWLLSDQLNFKKNISREVKKIKQCEIKSIKEFQQCSVLLCYNIMCIIYISELCST